MSKGPHCTSVPAMRWWAVPLSTFIPGHRPIIRATCVSAGAR